MHLQLGRIRNIKNLNVNQQLENIRTEMRNGFQQVNDAILQLNGAVRTVELNMISRLENFRILHDNVALFPLRGK